MNTLKNAALLLVMGGVLYFVYITLNKPPAPAGSSSLTHQHESLSPPEDLQITTPDLTQGGASSYEQPQTSIPPAPTFVDPGIVENDVPTADHDHPAYAVPPENGSYTLVEQAKPRRGGGFQDNGPPVAPEVIEYSPATPTPIEPEVGGYALNPAETSPRVDLAIKPATATAEIAPPVTSTLASYTIKQKFAEARLAVDQGRHREALEALTELYRRSDISAADRAILVQWLDPLAAKVIYSPEHTLAEAHKVARGEDLLTIAEKFQVPWLLLHRINNNRDPRVVVPGEMIKVIPGPFSADVNLAGNEMTLFVKDLYAGRFAFTIGDERPKPGLYQVREKSLDRAYYGADRTIPANDPSNPYGGCWIDLGSGVALHGSPTAGGVSGSKNHGCLSFSPQDAQDIFAILSKGSSVTIR